MARDTSLSRLRVKPEKEVEKGKAPSYNTRKGEKRCTHTSQYEEEDGSLSEDLVVRGKSMTTKDLA